jgi:hypothetical protein
MWFAGGRAAAEAAAPSFDLKMSVSCTVTRNGANVERHGLFLVGLLLAGIPWWACSLRAIGPNA